MDHMYKMDKYMVVRGDLVAVIISLYGHFPGVTYCVYRRRWSLSRSLQTRGEECVGVIDIKGIL